MQSYVHCSWAKINPLKGIFSLFLQVNPNELNATPILVHMHKITAFGFTTVDSASNKCPLLFCSFSLTFSPCTTLSVQEVNRTISPSYIFTTSEHHFLVHILRTTALGFVVDSENNKCQHLSWSFSLKCSSLRSLLNLRSEQNTKPLLHLYNQGRANETRHSCQRDSAGINQHHHKRPNWHLLSTEWTSLFHCHSTVLFLSTSCSSNCLSSVFHGKVNSTHSFPYN